jgi:glucose/arabinose dehydrogenase
MEKRVLWGLGGIFLTATLAAVNSFAQLPRIALGPVSVELQSVVNGLSSPVDLVSAHDGSNRLFVVEQTGKIRILKNGSLVATPFLDVSGQIFAGGERGLLSMAFHPGFSDASSPGFHKLYTYASEHVSGAADFTVPISGSFDNQGVLAEWKVSTGNSDVVDPSTRREVFRLDHPQGNHNGAKLAFRGSDHYLYISIGDGGAGNDVGNGHAPNIGNGQSTDRVLGKILRIDPLAPALTPGSADAASANGKYRVPRTNPFVGRAGLDEIFAYGFRNPFRYSFDSTTDQLVLGDVGQNAVEEVDIVRLGGNYGWNRKEGSFLFDPANGSISPDPNPNPGLINPIAEYGHQDGTAVIGGFIYRGTKIPALAGKYVFGDLSDPNGTGRLFYSDLSTHIIQELRLGTAARELGTALFSIGEDDAHDLYALLGSGQVSKIIPIPVSPAFVNLSTRARVDTGENVLIGGFIITGSAPKNIVLRALGPSLNVQGQPLAGRLANPILELHNSAGSLIASNDNWMTSAQRQQIESLGLAPPNAQESALLASLPPGSYTAIVRGVGGVGIGLVELYDVDQPKPADAVNISSRGRVQTGDNVMIAGFIVGGNQSRRVIVRALGPSLTARGIAGALGNPTLELRNSSGALIASNDNWRSNQEAEINATGLSPSNNNESATVGTLTPGGYSAVVRGVNDSTGVALVEVYRLP